MLQTKHSGRDESDLSSKKKIQVLEGSKDPNNIQKHENQDDELLSSEEKKRAFIQIASLNQMDINSTYDFLRQFFFGDDFTKATCIRLMDKYSDDIISSTNMLQSYIEKKYDTLSLMNDAKIIHEGINFVKSCQKKAESFMSTLPDGDIDSFSKLVSSGKNISSQFDEWNKRKQELANKLEAIAIDLSSRASNNDNKDGYLSGKKISNVLKKYGVEDVLAERLGAVIAHGDINS